MDKNTRDLLIQWAGTYNDPKYFQEDPISFPRRFSELVRSGERSVKDVEVAAIFAAHFAWGRRAMIVRDCGRLFDEMDWRPYDYVMRGEWRCDPCSIHRTVKWSEVAAICSRLKAVYEELPSLESLSQDEIRVKIFGQKPDLKAPNKKINMMRRWMVRNDGKVDLGLWKNTDPAVLLIPLDVHVYEEAVALGLTNRKQKDIVTVKEITGVFDDIFPGDPCKGDFALFGYGVTKS
ncbi:MAG: TIGR02757 family protein [Bacteroidales bacterium]|nr:TIGR02757 family protein [Bacteroidales bacterium]